jgi:hypothetical protein
MSEAGVPSLARHHCCRCLEDSTVVLRAAALCLRWGCRLQLDAVVLKPRPQCLRRGRHLELSAVVSKPRLWRSRQGCRLEGAVVVSKPSPWCLRRRCCLVSRPRLPCLRRGLTSRRCRRRRLKAPTVVFRAVVLCLRWGCRLEGNGVVLGVGIPSRDCHRCL